jgi:HAD superfamily hydrolase (TIGR01509 family)
MAFKGIFFDLYGTLLVFGDMHAAWADWLSALHRCLGQAGLRMDRDALARQCDGFFTRPEPPPIDGLTVFEARIQALAQQLGVGLDRRQVGRTAMACIEAWQSYVTLDPDAVPVLRGLRQKMVLALVSNYDHPPYVRCQLTQLGLARMFDAVVISGEAGVKKPDPAIFRIALEKTGLAAGDVAFVGDSESDMQGAAAAGMCPILIYRSSRQASHVLQDFHPDNEIVAIHRNARPRSARSICALPELITLL